MSDEPRAGWPVTVRAERGPLGRSGDGCREIDTPHLWLGSPTAGLHVGHKALFPPGRPGQCVVQNEKGYV